MSHGILWLNLRTVGDMRNDLGTYFPARSDIILVPFKRIYHPPNNVLQSRLSAAGFDSPIA